MASALTAFFVAAAAVVLLMFVLSVAIATAQEGLVSTFQARAPDIKRWGGRILLAVGAWLIVLAVFADFFGGLFPV